MLQGHSCTVGGGLTAEELHVDAVAIHPKNEKGNWLLAVLVMFAGKI